MYLLIEMNLVLEVANLDSVIESWAKCGCFRDVDRPCICSVLVISDHHLLVLLADVASLTAAHEASYADRCCLGFEAKAVASYELLQSSCHYSCS